LAALVTDFSTTDLRSEVENLRVQARADLSAEIIEVFRAAASDWSGFSPLPIADGRGGSVVVAPVAGRPRLLVRRYLRGGLPAMFVRGTYLGFRPRPFRELRIMKSLHQNGAPVAEPYGAAVQWLFPGCYRGWLATRFVEGSCTLWKWLRDHGPAADERRAVLAEVGHGIRKVRALGIWHADLNLHNILVVPHAPQRVVLIDFDKSRRATGDHIGAELKRLRRSARKLDPAGKIISDEDLAALRQF
jgi:3-deoxy-D-manno-octulosonic acid kinase